MNIESREVFTQIKTILSGDATLSAYVKHFYEGIRENLQPEDYPFICLEPQQENELREEVNTRRDSVVTVRILGFTFVEEGKLDSQIVGQSGEKGIMDLFEDVRNAIEADRQLSGKAITLDWIPTVYDFQGYPVRIFNCAVRAMHRRTVTL